MKGNSSWFFCRLPLVNRAAYFPPPSTPCGDRFCLITCVPTTPAADFCRPIRSNRRSFSPAFRKKRQISRGKFDRRLPHAAAEFTTSAFDGYGLRDHMPARPAPYASDPVLVHRLVRLLHASFRPRLTTMPLRFAMTSPPSGCQRDFHPRAVEHARHTKKGPGEPGPHSNLRPVWNAAATSSSSEQLSSLRRLSWLRSSSIDSP
jgi:hypothetical protein